MQYLVPQLSKSFSEFSFCEKLGKGNEAACFEIMGVTSKRDSGLTMDCSAELLSNIKTIRLIAPKALLLRIYQRQSWGKWYGRIAIFMCFFVDVAEVIVSLPAGQCREAIQRLLHVAFRYN